MDKTKHDDNLFKETLRKAISEPPLLFRLVTKEGHEYKLWMNGYSEGFPEGTIMINKASSFFYLLLSLQGDIGKEDIPTGCVADVQTKIGA